jgi:DNA mismatch repair protein MutS
MTEAAAFTNNATDKSLILMDEIGRGTSTADGFRWRAVRAHRARDRSFTLFATTTELTSLADEIDGCANVHLDATEHRDGIVFLHAVKDGPASRSYGLAVAQLAGVPREVIAAAREYLATLEKGGNAHGVPIEGRTTAGQRGRRTGDPTPQAQLPLEPPRPPPVDPRLKELEAALRAVSADDLTPKAALDLIYKLRALLG